MSGGRAALLAALRGGRSQRRQLCTPAAAGDSKSLGGLGGASGSRLAAGSGKSLMGSALRSLTSDQLEALAAGEEVGDTTLAGGDVLMEVRAHTTSRPVARAESTPKEADRNENVLPVGRKPT